MALLRAAFAAFRERGLTGVALEVDDVSMDGAVGLYRRAGMRIVRRTDVLEQLIVADTSAADERSSDTPDEDG
jgi:ribosomal protein S18 acetylase RimI-like enzyme